MEQKRPFLTAEWRWLALLQFEVPAPLLEPLLPSGTELDCWRDRPVVSLVGFRFLHTCVLGIPVPMHRNFTEVNLRFYVRTRGPEGWRRGVVFIRELVPRTAIALVARAVYNEPYRALPMRHSIEIGTEGGRVHYEWDFGGRRHGVSAVTSGPCEPLAEGSEAQFVAEHYWGYTRQRNSTTVEYQVRHPSWRAWRATGSVHGDSALTYGPAFGEALRGLPVSAYVAEGSAVEVLRPRRLPATDRLHP